MELTPYAEHLIEACERVADARYFWLGHEARDVVWSDIEPDLENNQD